jgi:hypothetical protein
MLPTMLAKMIFRSDEGETDCSDPGTRALIDIKKFPAAGDR